MEKEKLTFRQIGNELALSCYAGLAFGIPFGAGVFIGWHIMRGLVRLMVV